MKGFSVGFSLPYPHSACSVAERSAITIVGLHLTPSVFEEFSLSFCTLIVSHIGRFVKGFFTFFFEPCKVGQWLHLSPIPAHAGGLTVVHPVPLSP